MIADNGSFFRSQRANDIIGALCSVITLTLVCILAARTPATTVVDQSGRRAASGLDIYSRA